jgi:hypothetical protein
MSTVVTCSSFGTALPADRPRTTGGTGIAGSVDRGLGGDRHRRAGPARLLPAGGAGAQPAPFDRFPGAGGYPATVFQRFPRLTLVGIAVASFVAVVALIQLAGDLAT